MYQLSEEEYYEDLEEAGANSNQENVDPQPFSIYKHNPNKTFKRESVIASWKNVKREREQALGKKFVYVEEDQVKDYYGRDLVKVKRSESERTSAYEPRKRVKRTFSVIYRYDQDSERVIKEYKVLRPIGADNLTRENSARSSRQGSKRWYKDQNANRKTVVTLKKSLSEPLLVDTSDEQTKNKVKRSLTTLLNLKSKFFNIFTSKS